MNHRGFTLIELLIVIAILAMLAGMAMPLIGMARRSAEKTNTQAMLGVVNNAVSAFKHDVGAFPYRNPQHDDDAGSNDLAWRLWRPMQTTERKSLDAALAEVEVRFLVTIAGNGADPASLWTGNITSWATAAFTASEVAQNSPETRTSTLYGYDSDNSTYGILVNRMATLRAQAAILSGFTHVGRNNAATAAILSDPDATRGFCDDYLANSLPRRHQDGDSITDIWGTALGYICPVIQGGRRRIVGQPKSGDGTGYGILEPARYGLAPLLRTPTTARASNLRSHAGAAWIAQPELWSAGPDRLGSAHRDADSNLDNILAAPYLKGLQ